MDLFKGSLSTIKYLLRTNTIPYLIVNYNRKSMATLIIRDRINILCEMKLKEDGLVDMAIAQITEEGVDIAIRESTKTVIDYNILSEELFAEFIYATNNAYEIYKTKSIQIDKKGEKFTEGDYKALTRLAIDFKKHPEDYGN